MVRLKIWKKRKPFAFAGIRTSDLRGRNLGPNLVTVSYVTTKFNILFEYLSIHISTKISTVFLECIIRTDGQRAVQTLPLC
jgi:hypothetical protein